MHERGMADDELVEDHERERFAGTSAMQRDDGVAADRATTAAVRTSADRRRPPPRATAASTTSGRRRRARGRRGGRFDRTGERDDAPADTRREY